MISQRGSLRYPRLGFVLYMTSAQYFAVQAVVASRWSPPYSLRKNTISDLGNTGCGRFNARPVCSPLHDLMNISFVVLGMTMVFGSLFTYCAVPTRQRTKWGFGAMVVAGLGVVLVGLFPENSVSVLHGIGAALPFTVGNVAVVALALALPLPRSIQVLSVTAGVVALAALVSYTSNHDWGLGPGGIERVVAYPQTVWLVVVGAYFYLWPASKSLE